MTVTKKLVTKNFNVHNAKTFVDTVNSETNKYFIFVGKHVPYSGGDINVDMPTDSVQNSYIDVYDNMIFAKSVTTSDVKHMIRRVEWKQGTVYDEYSHDDADLYTKDFFVYVNDGYEYNVYKCLSNGNDSEATVAPFRVGNSLDYDPIYTGDGYIWKYMFTISKAIFDKFSSTSYIPLVANTYVIDNAVAGSIDIIKIVDSGSGYNNYISDGVFKTGDIRVSGLDTLYGAPESASSIEDYYTGCVLKVTSGGAEGQYRRIVGYDGASSPKTFLLNSPFTTTPSVNDTYEVYPYMYVFGDGNETTPAEALAIIDGTSSNGVIGIEILNHGAGYRYGVAGVNQSSYDVPYEIASVYIDVPAVIQNASIFSAASLKPIIPPKNGHGSDPYTELFANKVGISVKFTQDESGWFPVQNDFRQVGLIKDPEFYNVKVGYDTTTDIGSFEISETVKQYKNIKLLGNVTVIAGNSQIIKTDFGKISNTITILNSGTGYNSTTNNALVFSGGGGTSATATFTNNVSGAISSITVTSQGVNYTSAPVVTVNPSAGGSNAVLTATLSNPQNTTFADSLSVGDYVLVTDGASNFLSKVSSVPNDYTILMEDTCSFSGSNLELSKFEFTASGKVTALASGTLTLTNVTGEFIGYGKLIGLSSGASATATASSNITVNDKVAGDFSKAVQLTRLVGDWTAGAVPFFEDEEVNQTSLIEAVTPAGYLHHIETFAGAGNDIIHMSKEFGIFNLNRDVTGQSSGGLLSNISTIYKGDFVKGSGEVLYYENLDAITRSDNKSEIIKIILEF